MKRYLAILAMLTSLSAPAAANVDIVEGFAATTFRELTQTFILMGGMDINNVNVADEYGRLMYCDIYKRNFANDLEWNEIRKKMVARILEKKEYYRIQYQTVGAFKLGRYDFDRHYYPLSKDTAIVNVGEMILLTPDDYEPYCGLQKRAPFFPIYINLVLKRPLTIDKLEISEEDMRKMLARMEETKNVGRFVYGRVRFRVTDTLGLSTAKTKMPRAELRGEVQAVDFFLDRDLTQPVGSMPIIAQQ